MGYINRIFTWDFNALKRFYEIYVKGPLDGKVGKEAGKGLSANDYTTVEKQKLAGIQDGAEANVQADWIQTNPTSDAYIWNKPTIPDVSDYYTKIEIDTNIYNKTQVNNLLSAIVSITLKIVDELPTRDISTTTIYLVETQEGSKIYMQYLYTNGAWAQLGTTQVSLDDYYTKPEIDATIGNILNRLDEKQDTLVSGVNIKTINNQPLLGSGNIEIQGGGSYVAGDGIEISEEDVISVVGKADAVTVANHVTNGNIHVTTAEKTAWNNKQDALVSGTNIKTVNNQSLLGSGNINIESVNVDQTTGTSTTSVMSQNAVTTALGTKADATRLGGLSLVKLSLAEYTALTTKDDNTLYIIVD